MKKLEFHRKKILSVSMENNYQKHLLQGNHTQTDATLSCTDSCQSNCPNCG